MFRQKISPKNIIIIIIFIYCHCRPIKDNLGQGGAYLAIVFLSICLEICIDVFLDVFVKLIYTFVKVYISRVQRIAFTQTNT